MTEYEQAIKDAGITLCEVMGGYDQFSYLDDHLEAAKLAADKDRFAFVRRFGFAIPSEDALSLLACHAPILEVGAGTGYWAYELGKRGVYVVATDKRPWREKDGQNDETLTSWDEDGSSVWNFKRQWAEVLPLSALEAIKRYEDALTLMMVWPSYEEPWAAKALDAYKGRHFLYIGEYRACCADDRFFDLLEERFDEVKRLDIPVWSGIHDHLWVFKRKEQP